MARASLLSLAGADGLLAKFENISPLDVAVREQLHESVLVVRTDVIKLEHNTHFLCNFSAAIINASTPPRIQLVVHHFQSHDGCAL